MQIFVISRPKWMLQVLPTIQLTHRLSLTLFG